MYSRTLGDAACKQVFNISMNSLWAEALIADMGAGMAGQVLYNLCEWPAREGSRLVVIGIANHHQMDLDERLLPRIASRLGSRRCVRLPNCAPVLLLAHALPSWHHRCTAQLPIGLLMSSICYLRWSLSSII